MEDWRYPCEPSKLSSFARDCGHCHCPREPCDGVVLHDLLARQAVEWEDTIVIHEEL